MKLWKKLLIILLCMMVVQVPMTAVCGTSKVEAASVKKGLKKSNGKYYYYVNGKKVKNTWKSVKVTVNGKKTTCKYYFGKNGAAVTGKKTIGGKAYYFNSKGQLQTSKLGLKIGKKYYESNKNGVLTQLSKVEGLAGIRLEKSGKTLKAAFNWASGLRYYPLPARSNSYLKKNADYYGTYGFEKNRGDCNTMAYTFYWMAKRLGYDVHFVSGYVKLNQQGKLGKHAWCEIDTKAGKTWVYDPNFANAYGKGKGYKFTYGTKGTYQYTKYKRLN